MVYHEKSLHNCCIQCHGKHSDKHNKCDIRAAHDGCKVGCKVIASSIQRLSCILIGCMFYGMVQLLLLKTRSLDNAIREFSLA